MDDLWKLEINVKVEGGSEHGVTGVKKFGTREEALATLKDMIDSFPLPPDGSEETIMIRISNA